MKKLIRHFKLQDMPANKLNENVTWRLISGDNGDMGLCIYKKGAIVPVHQHESEQFSTIANGKMKVTVGEVDYIVGPGEAIIIPPNTPHIFEALEDDTYDFHFFSPSIMHRLKGDGNSSPNTAI